MAGENIPIDYLSDHLKNSFQLVVTFVPGCGFSGVVNFDGRQVYKSHYRGEAQDAFNEICEAVENCHIKFLEDIGR
jgi:hypothetical protein